MLLEFLSTPSARRATPTVQRSRCVASISIHALREEGDSPVFCGLGSALVFLSTPSARRATRRKQRTKSARLISIHALREEGDVVDVHVTVIHNRFLSTPSARRATPSKTGHALPLEDFYPRPPRGGRHAMIWQEWFRDQFLSTPSARRATARSALLAHVVRDFYPRPPRGGRHAKLYFTGLCRKFLSTPSARRATLLGVPVDGLEVFLSTPSARRATALQTGFTTWKINFYPRPPRGGRLPCTTNHRSLCVISIHALREEGDMPGANAVPHRGISIHALREEGDVSFSLNRITSRKFLSTPSARRATVGGHRDGGLLRFLSTPSARRATQ